VQSSRDLLGYYGLVALTSPLAVLGAAVAVVERSLGDGGELGLAVARPFLWAVRRREATINRGGKNARRRAG
jgi:hypothetical protein